MRIQDGQSSAEEATVQLECDRQVYGVESLYFRGKERTVHLLHTRAQQDCHSKKNWLGRKRLHYIETITDVEKQACNTIQGLFDMLATKFQPQFSETIKSLQFRKLCRSKDESAEEWMGWLWMATADCGYKEVDRQLKVQLIHGLNDKIMLDEIIRELTSRTGNVQPTSNDLLVLAKRVKAQRVQVSVLNDITKTKAFNKVKKETEPKNSWEEKCMLQYTKDSCADTAGEVTHQGNAQCMEKCVQHVARLGTSGKCAGAKETVQFMKIVSINSLYVNRKWSIIMAKLEMQEGNTALEIPYKIDTGSEGNLMPLCIFQKLFANIREEQLKEQ